MKTLLLSLVLYLLITASASAQAERIFQRDSLSSGRTSVTFTVNSRHNYNTFLVKNMTTSDSLRTYNINEFGDTAQVALRNLNTYTDLTSNLIRGYTGNQEFLVLHPNIYKLLITCTTGDVSSKSILLTRRGNNLK